MQLLAGVNVLKSLFLLLSVYPWILTILFFFLDLLQIVVAFVVNLKLYFPKYFGYVNGELFLAATVASICLMLKLIHFCKWKQHVDPFYMNFRFFIIFFLYAISFLFPFSCCNFFLKFSWTCGLLKVSLLIHFKTRLFGMKLGSQILIGIKCYLSLNKNV